MVEIRVAVDDATHVAGFTQRLATLFDRASISSTAYEGKSLSRRRGSPER